MGKVRTESKGGAERERRKEHICPAGPGRLPVVKVQGSRVRYYFDAKLKQLRNVENPHDYVDLSTEERDGIEWLVGQGRTSFKL
jgi:hypothetical protein